MNTDFSFFSWKTTFYPDKGNCLSVYHIPSRIVPEGGKLDLMLRSSACRAVTYAPIGGAEMVEEVLQSSGERVRVILPDMRAMRTR